MSYGDSSENVVKRDAIKAYGKQCRTKRKHELSKPDGDDGSLSLPTLEPHIDQTTNDDDIELVNILIKFSSNSTF